MQCSNLIREARELSKLTLAIEAADGDWTGKEETKEAIDPVASWLALYDGGTGGNKHLLKV